MGLITLFYFNFDNNVQLQVLKECGVKNVSTSYKYLRQAERSASLSRDGLSVYVGTGTGKRDFSAEQYYDWIGGLAESGFNVLQYDEPGETGRTISYYHMALERGLDRIIPILHEDYQVHLNYIKLILKTNIIALGKGGDHDEEDRGFDELRSSYNIHGLGKARWLQQDNPPTSVESSTWINPVRSGKLYVKTRDGYNEISIRDTRLIQDAIEENKDFAEKCGVKLSQIAVKDHKALLRASIGLYYMPKLKELSMYETNFY